MADRLYIFGVEVCQCELGTLLFALNAYSHPRHFEVQHVCIQEIYRRFDAGELPSPVSAEVAELLMLRAAGVE